MIDNFTLREEAHTNPNFRFIWPTHGYFFLINEKEESQQFNSKNFLPAPFLTVKKIISFRKSGLSIMAIHDALGIPFQQVQMICRHLLGPEPSGRRKKGTLPKTVSNLIEQE